MRTIVLGLLPSLRPGRELQVKPQPSYTPQTTETFYTCYTIKASTLQVPQRIASRGKDIALHIHPEGKDHIDDDGGAQCEQGGIHEPHTDAAGGDPHPFSNGGEHAKSLPFNEIFEPVHATKIIFFDQSINLFSLISKPFLINFAAL